jgi:hypothetical protein
MLKRLFLALALVALSVTASAQSYYSVTGLVGFGAGGETYAPGAVTFDGINDYMRRGADLTGNTDGKTGTVSYWVKFNGDGAEINVYSNTGGRHRFYRTAGNKILFRGQTVAGANILVLTSTTSIVAASGWTHVLASWNLATPEAYLYINGTDDEAAGSTETNATIERTVANHSVGDDVGGSGLLNADIADLWISWEYVDITQAANRAKFISASGKPVDLGADGSVPTGTAPIMYFRHVTGAAATDFATNLGGGGNFSITGALVEATGP